MKRIIVETVVVQSEVIGQVSIEEACQICHIEVEFFHALVDEGVFDISGEAPSLRDAQLARLKKASRLYNDLGVNPPGIALVLELLERAQR